MFSFKRGILRSVASPPGSRGVALSNQRKSFFSIEEFHLIPQSMHLWEKKNEVCDACMSKFILGITNTNIQIVRNIAMFLFIILPDDCINFCRISAHPLFDTLISTGGYVYGKTKRGTKNPWLQFNSRDKLPPEAAAAVPTARTQPSPSSQRVLINYSNHVFH